MTSPDAVDWTETSLVPPIDTFERDPQLAVDGATLQLAFNALAPEEGGCGGGDGLRDIGVFIRNRDLPNGAWFDQYQLGNAGDSLQAFRATRGVLHLTVRTQDGAGPVVYESMAGSAQTRIEIPDAVTTSLRVGDDGRARVAFSTGHAIRYGQIDGGELTSEIVAESSETNLLSPLLVLAPGDAGYMIWTQSVSIPGAGCSEPGPGPLDGTYFGTNASGRWMSTRLTRDPYGALLTLDPSTDRLHVIATVGGSLTYLTSDDGATWTSSPFPVENRVQSSAIRLDPTTGRPLVFGIGSSGGIYIIRSEP